MQNLIFTLALIVGGCNDGSNLVKDIPVGAPPAEVAESNPRNAALIECGYPDQDCAAVNLDLLKIKGKSEASSHGEEKGLDCTSGRMARNSDGTWNLCKCTCVPASHVGKI